MTKKFKCSMQKTMENLGKSRKKLEASKNTITMNIDYNTFMILCANAAYLTDDKDYHDALWEYFFEFGEISGTAGEFFDNLFQYTNWCDAEELWDEYLSYELGDKPKDKTYDEIADTYLNDNGWELADYTVQQFGDHYLLIR